MFNFVSFFVLYFGISKIVNLKRDNVSSDASDLIIELNNPFPDLSVLRNLSLSNNKYIIITFFRNYCDACNDVIRRRILNEISNMYGHKLEIIGVFEDFTESDIDNFKKIYPFNFRILGTKEKVYFKRGRYFSFPSYPYSILAYETKNVIFMENGNYIHFLNKLKEILTKDKF